MENSVGIPQSLGNATRETWIVERPGREEMFKAGVEWADAHPRWHDMSEEPQKYDDFLVITKGGCMDFAHFNQDGWHKSHYDGSSDFLYWMTPPAMPKGGEE
jgi:hypothetical protein